MFLKTIIKSVFSRSTFSIILWVVALGLLSGVGMYFKEAKKAFEDNERLVNNVKNYNQMMESFVTENGNLVQSVQTLTVKQNELIHYNKEIVEELADMKIKLKDVAGVTQVDNHYTISHDTIPVKLKPKSVKLSETRYNYSMKDSTYLNFKTDIVLDKIENKNIIFDKETNTVIIDQDLKPKLENFYLDLADKLLIVPEYQYKRSWIFWKKVNGLKLHIKSENPYIKIDKIESYNITK